MKKTPFLLIVVLSLAVLLASCTNQGGSGTSASSNPFIGGTNGILMEFEEDQPPREVFDNNELPFDITVRLENRGEENILPDDLEVRIRGIRPEEFGVTEADLRKKPTDTLVRTYQDSEGGRVDGSLDFITFPGLSFQNSLAGNQEFTVRADVCYKYKTRSTSQICITRDILDTTFDTVCRVNEAKPVFNSGAPIQITNFRESPRGRNKIQFSFDVTHSSSGEFFRADSGCEFITANERVALVEVRTGIPGMSCTGWRDNNATSGHVTLHGGRPRTVTCSQDATTTTDFEQIVNIETTYDYLMTRDTRLLVKHAIN